MAAFNCCALYWCVSVLMFPFTAQGFLPTMLTKLSQMEVGCLQQQNLLWMGMVWFQTKMIRGLWNTYKHIGSYCMLPILCRYWAYVERIRNLVGVIDKEVAQNSWNKNWQLDTLYYDKKKCIFTDLVVKNALDVKKIYFYIICNDMVCYFGNALLCVVIIVFAWH